MLSGSRYEIVEGIEAPKRTAFLPRKKESTDRQSAIGNQQSHAVHGENTPQLQDTWLLEPVPLPQKHNGPGFVCLAGPPPVTPVGGVPFEVVDLSKAAPDTAAVYALFRRYLFDWRSDLFLPLVFLVDAESLAHKVYPSIPSASVLRADLEKLRGRQERLRRTATSSTAVRWPILFPASPSILSIGGSFLVCRISGPGASIPERDCEAGHRPITKRSSPSGRFTWTRGGWTKPRRLWRCHANSIRSLPKFGTILEECKLRVGTTLQRWTHYNKATVFQRYPALRLEQRSTSLCEDWRPRECREVTTACPGIGHTGCRRREPARLAARAAEPNGPKRANCFSKQSPCDGTMLAPSTTWVCFTLK